MFIDHVTLHREVRSKRRFNFSTKFTDRSESSNDRLIDRSTREAIIDASLIGRDRLTNEPRELILDEVSHDKSALSSSHRLSLYYFFFFFSTNSAASRYYPSQRTNFLISSRRLASSLASTLFFQVSNPERARAAEKSSSR